jgi:Holliday junction DNA helicase RuvA
MFYYLCGNLEINEPGVCVVDCGGVGYKLTTSLITYELLSDKVGQKVKIFTHLAVREDGIELFGFESCEERECFNKLITVSGVGPKAAMSILSIMTPDNFALSVCTEDVKAISKAQGIGAKTAARIVLELKDKVAQDFVVSTDSSSGISMDVPHAKSSNISEATEALMVLGYDKNTVLNAIKSIDPSLDPGTIIKMALKKLAR